MWSGTEGRSGRPKVRNETDIKEKDAHFCIRFFPLMASAMHCGSCSLTLQALCTGIVHCPTDQRHRDAKQYEEDPIFSQPGHKESLDPRDTVCKTQTSNAHTKNPSSASSYLNVRTAHLCTWSRSVSSSRRT